MACKAVGQGGQRAGGHRPNTMAIEIGSTVEGTVVKLADYGAIVRLAGGKMGLVHISEVADAYVRDVRDYFKENDRICVKVLKVNEKGRYELSAKQAETKVVPHAEQAPARAEHRETQDRSVQPEHHSRDRAPLSFEDKLSRFMKDSEERLHDLKRNIDAKRGARRR